MRLFGKKVFAKRPLTPQEQEARQARERLANMKRIQRAEREQRNKARADAESSRRYQEEQQRLNRQGNIETARTRIARQRAARASAQEKRLSGYSGTIKGVGALVGIKSSKSNQSRPRPVYVSTSHGLKKITPDDPRYYEYQDNSSPKAKRIVVRSEDSDQPSAFSGL